MSQKQRRARGGGVLNDIRNKLRKAINPNSEPAFSGEYHIPAYNYCGPGTRYKERKARGDKPINALDAVCERHDGRYQAVSDNKSLSKDDRARLVREADQAMLSEMKNVPNSLAKGLAKMGIGGKSLIEKIIRRPIYGGKNGCVPHKKGKGKIKLAVMPRSPRVSKVGAGTNPWLAHVKAYRAEHPELSYKQVLQQAKTSYKK